MENTNPPSRQTVLIIASGFFVAFCLFVYQAYGISGGASATGHSLWFRAVAFGLITAGCFAFNERWIYPKITSYIKKKIHWLAWHIWEIAIGGTSVFLAYNAFWYWNDMYWLSWGKLLLEYAGILIIPIIGSHAYEAYLNKTAALANAKPQIIKEKLLSITAANGKEEIRLLPKDLLLVKAEDNYVRLVFLQNQKPSFLLIRNTISNIEKLLKETSLMRCHRSFMVNTSHLKQVLNKSNKLYIHLEGIDEAIPVSAKYQSYFDSPQIDEIRHKSPI